MTHLELPKENYFLTQAKIRKRNADRYLNYLKAEAPDYFYTYKGSLYEREFQNDSFTCVNSDAQFSATEDELIQGGATKHYYNK